MQMLAEELIKVFQEEGYPYSSYEIDKEHDLLILNGNLNKGVSKDIKVVYLGDLITIRLQTIDIDDSHILNVVENLNHYYYEYLGIYQW